MHEKVHIVLFRFISAFFYEVLILLLLSNVCRV